MFKNNSKVLAAVVAVGIAALGVVQYLALSGLIPVAALGRVHWIFLPAYSIGGAFGVMFQWFLIAGLVVYILPEIAKRRRANAPAASDDAPQAAPRTPPSFGRLPRR